MDIDAHHERISWDRVYWAPNSTQHFFRAPSTGSDASTIPEPTAIFVPTALRLSVSLQLPRGLSDLLDSQQAPSISPLLLGY